MFGRIHLKSYLVLDIIESFFKIADSISLLVIFKACSKVATGSRGGEIG